MGKIIVSAAIMVILFGGCVTACPPEVGEEGHIYDVEAYKAYVDFSDNLGAHGFYASEEYERLARFNDAIDPLHLYDY